MHLFKFSVQSQDHVSFLRRVDIRVVDAGLAFLPWVLLASLNQRKVLLSQQVNYDLICLFALESCEEHFDEEGELFDFFSDEQQDSILHFATDKLSISEQLFHVNFSKIKPVVISQMFAMISNTKEDSTAQNIKSHEAELNLLAKIDSIPIIGFETAKEQITLFDDLPKEVQTEMVMEQVRGVDNIGEFLLLTELYKSQNVDSMYYFIHNSDSYFSDYEEEFLSKRNRSWIQKIKEIVSKQSAFIAVGAGHLGGPNGLIRLLQQEGYRVKPIQL